MPLCSLSRYSVVLQYYTENGNQGEATVCCKDNALMHRLYRSNLETALGKLDFLVVPERPVVDHLFRLSTSVHGISGLYLHRLQLRVFEPHEVFGHTYFANRCIASLASSFVRSSI